MQCAWHSASRLGLATSHVLPTTPGCDHQTGQHRSHDWDICAKHLHYASREWRSKTELSKCIHSCPACRAHWFPELGGTALASPGTSETAASGPRVTYICRLSSLYINQNVFLSISVSQFLFFYSWPLNAPSSPFPEVFFVGIVKLEWGCSGSRWGHQSPGRELRTEARAVVSGVGRDYLQQRPWGLGP